jgi:hypothetical protein
MKFNFIPKVFPVQTRAIDVEKINHLVVPFAGSSEKNPSTSQEWS